MCKTCTYSALLQLEMFPEDLFFKDVQVDDVHFVSAPSDSLVSTCTLNVNYNVHVHPKNMIVRMTVKSRVYFSCLTGQARSCKPEDLV